MKTALWLLLLIPNFVIDFLAFPLAPLIVLLDEKRATQWFVWFLTPDNPMTGDAGHEARWAGRPVYLKKVAWLWRNRANGFATSVLGARTEGPVSVKGDIRVSNHPLFEGLVRRSTPEGYWQFYYVKRSFKGRCLRVNLGWKLWGARPSVASPRQYVCSINPLMGYSHEISS